MSTAAELADLPYATNPFSQGIITEDYRTQFHEHGERVRHWMAYNGAPDGAMGPNGETANRHGILYVENVLPEEVRVLITETQREVYDVDFGLLSKGRASIACLPDELEPARNDRFVLLDKLFVGRLAIACSGESSDSLGRSFVREILSVIADGEVLSVSDYQLTEAEDGTSEITWGATIPQTALINFRHNPAFIYLDVSDRNPPRGADQKRLPIRGILTMEK
ncbi:MAG TPA: hypothetical protein VGB45_14610, partial [Abditibacterium sp.]